MRKSLRKFDGILGFVLLAVIWEAGVALFDVKPYLLPSMTAVLDAFWSNRGALAEHALITTVQVIAGFIAAVIGGVAISVLVFFFEGFRRMVMPVIVAIQGIPKVALAPLMIVWCGYGASSKILMAFLFAFFPIVIATLGGLSGTPAHLLEHFRAMNASPVRTFWRLRVPSALPIFVDGCKLAMPLAVIGAIVGEFVGSETGLGSLILLANASGKTDLMFAVIILITLISCALYSLIDLAGRRVWWRAV